MRRVEFVSLELFNFDLEWDAHRTATEKYVYTQ